MRADMLQRCRVDGVFGKVGQLLSWGIMQVACVRVEGRPSLYNPPNTRIASCFPTART